MHIKKTVKKQNKNKKKHVFLILFGFYHVFLTGRTAAKNNIQFQPYSSKLFFRFLFIIIFLKQRPDVIVTTGTHTAVPMCYIAKVFRKKVIYIETFANRNSKTVAGRFVYPIADVFVVQWEEMKKIYPKAEYWGWIY